MLVADKVQNLKDFVLHHLGSHKRSDELYRYYHRWLQHLGVDALDHRRYLEAISNG